MGSASLHGDALGVGGGCGSLERGWRHAWLNALWSEKMEQQVVKAPGGVWCYPCGTRDARKRVDTGSWRGWLGDTGPGRVKKGG